MKELIAQVKRVCDFLSNNGFTNDVRSIELSDGLIRIAFESSIENNKLNSFTDTFPFVFVSFARPKNKSITVAPLLDKQ